MKVGQARRLALQVGTASEIIFVLLLLLPGCGAGTDAGGAKTGGGEERKDSRIVFVSNLDGDTGSEIYAMNADGTGQTRLTKNNANDFSPAWPPE